MDCSTIIVSYNTFELTREAVRTALEADPDLRHEVIVVDNASPDGSAERLREAFPERAYPHVRVLANADNPGFSAANNQGAAAASGHVLFFLNPDTLVHPGAIGVLCEFLAAHPDVGAVGPHVLNPDGSDQPSTYGFDTAGKLLRHYLPVGALLRGRDAREDFVPDRTAPVDVVKGCALALRREVFDEVGGWDASYFMYSEETELCWQLRQRGYTNYFVREARITHYGGQSTLDRYAEHQVMERRSALAFLRRHGNGALVLLNRALGFSGFAGRAALFAALARLRPAAAAEYRRRGEAASALWRWFLFDYS